MSPAVDTQIDGNRIANVRDYGILVTGGSAQCSNNHVFGATYGIQFANGPSRSLADRFSDAAYGFRIDYPASGSHVADGTTEHCWMKNMQVDANRVRIHNTRILVANTSDHNQGSNNSGITSIVGLHLTFNAILALVSDCDVEVGAHTFSHGGAPDTGVKGSTGIFVEAHNVIIDNLKVVGDASGVDVEDEIGVRVAADREGGDFFIDARGGGFDDGDDCVVKFDASDCTGQVWYILYADGDRPVEIPANWGPSLKIFKRSNLEGEWTQLTSGQAYP